MAWKVAPSYKYWNIVRVDEENKKAYITNTCEKCGGSGQYLHFGTCYRCGGAGKFSKVVKAYTPEEYDKYVANQEKARVRKAEKEKARIADLENNSEANKKAWLEANGYDANSPFVYLVAGGSTYNIKEELKTRGGRYNAALNWYFTKETEVPEGYQLVAVDFDSVFDWYPLTKRVEIKDEAKGIAAAARKNIKTDSKSEFIGSEKERLRDMRVTLTDVRAISTVYGESLIFTFDYNDNVLVWFTTSVPDEDKAIVGTTYSLTGTVKKHEIYNGVKQTYLNRCIIKTI